MSASLKAYYVVVYVAQVEQLLLIHLLGSALNLSVNIGCCTITELVGVNVKTCEDQRTSGTELLTMLYGNYTRSVYSLTVMPLL